MSLILRVDVDKPYGRSKIFKKVLSKTREEFYFPRIEILGYLEDLNIFLDYLELNSIFAHIYFRNCTTPSTQTINKIKIHKIGFHAENTQSIDTFKRELDSFKSKFPELNISSFTKHGSGILKLGKEHHPKYEPQKYLRWSKDLNIDYLFGNSAWSKHSDKKNTYYEHMYWINKAYRTNDQPLIPDIVQMANSQNIVILIHPSNYISESQVKNDFHRIVHQSKLEKVDWITL